MTPTNEKQEGAERAEKKTEDAPRSASGHTPAPWTWERFNEAGAASIGVGPRGGQTAIAILTRDSHESRAHQEANARLIAAAPDLLAALRWMMKHARNEGWLLASSAVGVINTAQAAIDKAEGL